MAYAHYDSKRKADLKYYHNRQARKWQKMGLSIVDQNNLQCQFCGNISRKSCGDNFRHYPDCSTGIKPKYWSRRKNGINN